MSTLDQIIALNDSDDPGSAENWVQFEQRLVELVQACEGDYRQIQDPFTGFCFITGPAPPPALLKRTYTVFDFRLKADYETPLELACKAVGTGRNHIFALEHLKAILESNPEEIMQYIVEPNRDGEPDAQFSFLVSLCLHTDLIRWDEFTNVVRCIRWMVESFPALIHMNSSMMDMHAWQYHTATHSILAMFQHCLHYCVAEDAEPLGDTSRAYLKDSLFKLHATCCKSRGIHGESNIFVNLLSSCIDVQGIDTLEFLSHSCRPEDFLSTASVNLYDIILASPFLGDNPSILQILSKVQPDITTLTSGVPLCAAAASEGLSLSTVYSLLSANPSACLVGS